MTDLALTAMLEGALLHVWPSVECEMCGAWALRFAYGYSARANSASALSPTAVIDETLLQRTEDFFAARGLPSQFRLSPLAAPGSIAALKARGYSFKDEAVTMVAPLSAHEQHHAITISPVADEAWLAGVTALNEDESKRRPDHLKAITSRMRRPAGFASISQAGRTAGYGVCAIHDGWAELGSIVMAPEMRGQGLGRALFTSLLGWARAEGATNAFLQVDVNNVAALALYRSLGFADCYRYSTWRRDG